MEGLPQKEGWVFRRLKPPKKLWVAVLLQNIHMSIFTVWFKDGLKILILSVKKSKQFSS